MIPRGARPQQERKRIPAAADRALSKPHLPYVFLPPVTPHAPAPRAAIELYYPAPTQTLWDVAKQYGISPDALAEANGLICDAPNEKDSLVGKKFLLIP